ncbi:DUF2357 domain-containing protein [Arthrobacter sp. KN11-1C]|uniref:DUF2357 domain-containing protein n=1 Tax=Arthrobacter sp. KN11-1C TaxID=3445774 RepID=UPI003FA0F472
MASDLLVQVSTDFAVVEIRGPKSGRSTLGRRHADSPPLFTVDSTDGRVSVSVGAAGEWQPPGVGTAPAFFEDALYKIRVLTKHAGAQPRLVHRNALLFKDVDAYEDSGSVSGPFSFGRQVGLCTFAVLVGAHRLSVTLEVFPTKIDYAEDYQGLLVDVAQASRGLALEYMRSTYRSSQAVDVDSQSNLEWITLLRNEIQNLDQAIRYVNTHPRRTLSRTTALSRIEDVRANDSTARKSILTGAGAGQSLYYAGLGPVKQFVQSNNRMETLDTPEHRWLRHALARTLSQLTEITQAMDVQVQAAQNRNHSTPVRLIAEIEEVRLMAEQVGDLLALPIFQDVGSVPPAGFGSLQLHSAAGYGDAYRSILILRQGLAVTSPGDKHHSLSDLHDLYEIWCFIAVVTLILKISDAEANLEDLLTVSEEGIRVRLAQGRRSSVQLPQGEGSLQIVYNWAFKGLTGQQRPDITLRFIREGWPDLYVVLDAKYRVDASAEMQAQYGMAAPPPDAINALHRYRDAIVVGSGAATRSRPVVKGVALYPLNRDDSEAFADSGLAMALDALGIGAIPFLPGNKSHLEGWLRALLALPQEKLAEPGPPFSGLEHLRQITAGQ